MGHDTLKIPTRARAPAWKATPAFFTPWTTCKHSLILTNPKPTNALWDPLHAIRKQETQWKMDKVTFSSNLEATLNTRLASMDTKIVSVLSSLNATVATAIKAQMESLKTKIAKIGQCGIPSWRINHQRKLSLCHGWQIKKCTR
jgi:hypothetical protein